MTGVSWAALALLLAALASATVTFRAEPGLDGYWDDVRVADVRSGAGTNLTWRRAESFGLLRLALDSMGDLCLSPSWADVAAMRKPSLRHLQPAADSRVDVSGPGPLVPGSVYVLLQLGVLLHDGRMRAAAHRPARVAADVLVIGLGAGSGIVAMFHHMPNVRITVVEADEAVVATSKAHVPLLRWLVDDAKAISIVVADGVEFVEHAAAGSFDVIVVDAYSSGLEIPPAFVTVDWFRQAARVLRPDGVLFANIIDRLELPADGYAARVLVASQLAGLPHAVLFPLLAPELNEPEDGVRPVQRNIGIAFSRELLSPQGNEPCWRAIRKHELYPQFAELRHTWSEIRLARLDAEGQPIMVTERTPAWFAPETLVQGLQRAWLANLPAKLKPRRIRGADYPPMDGHYLMFEHAQLAQHMRAAVLETCAQRSKRNAAFVCPRGWQNATAERGVNHVFYTQVDMVQLSRSAFREAVAASERDSERTLAAFFARAEVQEQLLATATAVVGDAALGVARANEHAEFARLHSLEL